MPELRLTPNIREVFGGEYVVHQLRTEERRRFNAGVAALKQYNGLELVLMDGAESEWSPVTRLVS